MANIHKKTVSSDDVKKTWTKHLASIDLSRLKFLDEKLSRVLQMRINEAGTCLVAGAPLATIVLCGSVLEGILREYASKHREKFDAYAATVKKKSLEKLSLKELVDASYKAGLLKRDVKTYGKELVEFRNYIHPHKQVKKGFDPRGYTMEMCVRTLSEAINDLGKATK